jgi:hypothetical protein
MMKFKSTEKVNELIAAIRSNPDYLTRFVDCELGKIPISDIVDFLDIAFPGIVSNFIQSEENNNKRSV